METPNRVDVNEICETIERITARIMDMLPDKMFYVNYDVTRDSADEMDLLATLLRDCTKVLKDTAKANWSDRLEGIRTQYSTPSVQRYRERKAERAEQIASAKRIRMIQDDFIRDAEV